MDIFYEANAHCRWKSVLNDFLPSINIEKYKYYWYFEYILRDVIKETKNIHGLGPLTAYDISVGIANKHNIKIHQVYIIGNGPKRAIELLNLSSQLSKRNIGGHTFHFVTIQQVKNAFKKSKYTYNIEFIENTYNGDALESYLCNWQKSIPK